LEFTRGRRLAKPAVARRVQRRVRSRRVRVRGAAVHSLITQLAATPRTQAVQAKTAIQTMAFSTGGARLATGRASTSMEQYSGTPSAKPTIAASRDDGHVVNSDKSAVPARIVGLCQTGRVVRSGMSSELGVWLMCGLTFEVSWRQRQDAKPKPQKMYTVPVAWAWWPAVGAQLDRGVRHQTATRCARASWANVFMLFPSACAAMASFSCSSGGILRLNFPE
jgi:hypothetical protein